MILYVLIYGFFDDVFVNDILVFEEVLYDYFDVYYDNFFEIICIIKDLLEEVELDVVI